MFLDLPRAGMAAMRCAADQTAFALQRNATTRMTCGVLTLGERLLDHELRRLAVIALGEAAAIQ